ncbi:hypothetical protein ABZS66_52925 [Dactylosporangium sp. NPDC005572]|uniref:hypothetical protein n=1 Tax=Dactylosporangium sp. NPDC005572 TaxID=3156889 RepID=UPI0033B535F0
MAALALMVTVAVWSHRRGVDQVGRLDLVGEAPASSAATIRRSGGCTSSVVNAKEAVAIVDHRPNESCVAAVPGRGAVGRRSYDMATCGCSSVRYDLVAATNVTFGRAEQRPIAA